MEKMPGSVTRENCGTVFKELRQRFGSMSVAELARTLGVARSTVMRVEAGQTIPSDDLLNRLKAIQVIGISKFRALSEKDRTRFLQLIEEIGESPETFSRAITKRMVKELTPAGILAGLEGGPGDVAHRGVDAVDALEGALLGQPFQVGHPALLHQPHRQRVREAVQAESENPSLASKAKNHDASSL